MRAPSLLRALVVRLTIVVVLAVAGSYLLLYFEFRNGLWGLEGQSIAIQVQHLRAAIVSGTGPPRLELPPSLKEFYAQPDTFNGYQLLSADGTVLESGGFSAAYLPMPVAQGDGQIVMQRETDVLSGNSIMAASLDLDPSMSMIVTADTGCVWCGISKMQRVWSASSCSARWKSCIGRLPCC